MFQPCGALEDNPAFCRILASLKQGSLQMWEQKESGQLVEQVGSFLLSSILFLIIYEAEFTVTERRWLL